MDFVPFDHFHPIPPSPNTPTFGNKSMSLSFFLLSLFFKIPHMSEIMDLPFFDLVHLAECLQGPFMLLQLQILGREIDGR